MHIDTVYYFGYGANRDPAMMQAIIGRIPEKHEAKLFGFELGIQSWSDIPEKVRQRLAPGWDETFRSYVVRPTQNASDYVKGVIWKLTRHERSLLDAWELTGDWYTPQVTQYETAQGHAVQMEVQAVVDQPISTLLKAKRYKNFINSKEKMLKIAESLRN